jgi:hypothetical protein
MREIEYPLFHSLLWEVLASFLLHAAWLWGLIYLYESVSRGNIDSSIVLTYKLWLAGYAFTVSTISVFCTLLYFRLGDAGKIG